MRNLPDIALGKMIKSIVHLKVVVGLCPCKKCMYYWTWFSFS